MDAVALMTLLMTIYDQKKLRIFGSYWVRFAGSKEFDQKTAVTVKDLRIALHNKPVHFHITGKTLRDNGLCGILTICDTKYQATIDAFGNIHPQYTIR